MERCPRVLLLFLPKIMEFALSWVLLGERSTGSVPSSCLALRCRDDTLGNAGYEYSCSANKADWLARRRFSSALFNVLSRYASRASPSRRSMVSAFAGVAIDRRGPFFRLG